MGTELWRSFVLRRGRNVHPFGTGIKVLSKREWDGTHEGGVQVE